MERWIKALYVYLLMGTNADHIKVLAINGKVKLYLDPNLIEYTYEGTPMFLKEWLLMKGKE